MAEYQNFLWVMISSVGIAQITFIFYNTAFPQNILCFSTLRMTGQALEICRQLCSFEILILMATQSIVTKYKVMNTTYVKGYKLLNTGG